MAKKPSSTNQTKSVPAFGWTPDLPDHRDHVYGAPLAKLTATAPLPAKADLRRHCPPVYNQGHIGSCTANAIAAALEFDRKKQKLTDFIPSRLFIYYNERAIEHSTGVDAGAMIRDGIKSVGKKGACPETEWTYDDTEADGETGVWPPGAKPAQKPPKSCYTDAKKFQALNYQRVNRDLTQMKGCLADGFPFVFGFTVYRAFVTQEVANTGILNLPAPGEPGANADGSPAGHAVLAVGYNDKDQRFIVRNSWGKTWGIKGYFTMPYTYLLDGNLSDDFWTIRLVE
jgi:C1A family cysteine protease